VMITGGSGFIGSNLARQLVEARADVMLVDSLIPDYGGNLFTSTALLIRARESPTSAAVRRSYLVRGARRHLQQRGR